MPGRIGSPSASGLVVSCLLSLLPLAARAQIRLDLPAQPLAQALTTLGSLANVNIYFDAPTVDGLRAPALKAELSAGDALTRLLAGTRLHAVRVDENTFRLVVDTEPKHAQSARNPATGAVRPSSNVHLASAATDAASSVDASTGTPSTSDRDDRAVLAEVVVSAQKREERLLDVPMSLTALGGDQLESSQSFRLEDYVGKVPGLTLIEYGALGSQLAIRGITTGVFAVNSLVATYVDETPYTTEGPFAASFIATPNIDTFDMARIEVLRGPQGTLYGANALGGILKYVTNAPDPSGFAAKADVSGNTVDGGGNGFDAHGMVNVPITQYLALRAIAYEDYYAGFIDDPGRGLKDVNGSRVAGSRVALQYQPTSDFSVRLNAVYQERRWNDWGTEDVAPNTLVPLYGNWTHNDLEGQPGHATTELYNATINWNVGFANLVSASSYYDEKIPYSYDYSKMLGAYVSQLLGAPYGIDLDTEYHISAFTQEVRLASPQENAARWLAGAYFNDEHAVEHEYLYPIDPATHTLVYNLPNLGTFDIPTSYREYAAFANFDYRFTPTFDVGIGGRYSENHQKFHETANGTFGGGLNYGNPSSQGVFTYSTDVSWHFTDKQMLYGRIASGYAPGGPNNAITTADVPSSYEASTSVNYEVGLKSSLLNKRLTAEISAFLVDWRKIQLDATIGGETFTTNAGGARSEGVEWSFAYVPLAGLTLSLNGAYTDAYLTEPTPASINGSVGERLPAVPMWQSSASGEYRWPVFGDVSGLAGLDWRFSSSRFAEFEPIGPRQQLPSFSLFDLRGGLQSTHWQVTVFARNVLNKLAINYVQPNAGGGFGPQSATVYAPRTLGVTVGTTF